MYFLRNFNAGVPLLLLAVLALMTLRVPPFLLDMAFTFNIAIAIVVLLVSVYALRPLEFGSFPTVLLVVTLFRLALNVASTRVVLLDGHDGGDAAGKVIQAFGEVVVGGNYVVGLVVFIILVIINFVVVTKGAGRVSEVSARFTLDAMPGKQMAIDADLNAGIIDQNQAKTRREDVSMEADFYGAMDGASKFVRGDAVAGILILLINIIGGLTIGMVQHDMSFGNAVEVFTLLTIGDGLVAQIPSLLLSTAAAIMVTRVSGESDMSQQVSHQLFGDPRALAVASVVLLSLGLVPGMPHLVFLGLGSLTAIWAYMISKRNHAKVEDEISPVEIDSDTRSTPQEIGWEDIDPVDRLGLEVGYRLIPLVDSEQGGVLLSRIRGVRKKLSQELGFLVPAVHIRDNLDLVPSGYRILLLGVEVAEAEIYPDKLLAIDPGEVFGRIEGIETKDPAFGLSAIWIDEQQKEHAQTLGYTVVDPSTVVATHLNHIMQENSGDLLGHDEVSELVNRLSGSSPKLAEQLVPGSCTLGVLLKVLQNLLKEKIPVRDLRSIAESIIEAAATNKDPDHLVTNVRKSLGRLIIQNIYGSTDSIDVITLEPELEQLLMQARRNDPSAPSIEPSMAERLQRSMVDAADRQDISGKPAVLLVSSSIRSLLARFARFSQKLIHVLSYDEVPDSKQITVVSTIGRGVS